MFEKHLWKSDILSKDAVHRPASLLKMSLFHRCFFKHFGSKSQLPGLSIIETLVENGLRTLFNTWKGHYRQLQVPTMIFNKKALENVSSILNSKKPPWNLLSFLSRIVVNKFLKNSVQNCFSFALISNYWQNYKNTFYNNTHLLEQSSLNVSARGVFTTLSNN